MFNCDFYFNFGNTNTNRNQNGSTKTSLSKHTNARKQATDLAFLRATRVCLSNLLQFTWIQFAEAYFLHLSNDFQVWSLQFSVFGLKFGKFEVYCICGFVLEEKRGKKIWLINSRQSLANFYDFFARCLLQLCYACLQKVYFFSHSFLCIQFMRFLCILYSAMLAYKSSQN